MSRSLLIFTAFLFVFFFERLSLAQDSNNSKQESVSIYKSEIDDLLTIRKISVLPMVDNVNGIYSRPLEQHLVELLKKDHRWDQVDLNVVGPITSPDELEDDPTKVKQVAGSSGADAVLASRISRGPKGVLVKLDLFLTKDQKLISQSISRDLQKTDVNSLKEEVSEGLKRVLGKIPYSGIVLSRQNLRVTTNLGKRDGLQPGQVLSVVQVISMQRHPKFKFMISSEKEIIGRIKVIKVDDTLSFGQIISEKAKGAIQKFAKIGEIDFVNYTPSDSLSLDNQGNPLENRTDSDVSFGKNPNEWTPKKPPTFGMVGARFGLGAFDGNMQKESPTVESLDSRNALYPSVSVDAELWVMPNWTMNFGLKQGIIPISNPKSGSSTDDLSQSLSSYEFLLSYSIRIQPGAFGSRVDLSFGYSSYRLFVDYVTDGLTTLQYNGMKFGVNGKYPVTDDQLWLAGAKLFFFYQPTLKESPESNGKSTNSINQFGFFVDRKLSENLMLRGMLDFELYSTSFSGGNASSASQKHTTLSGGIYYLF